eukprot:85482-Hanusia_phi.AAC.1
MISPMITVGQSDPVLSWSPITAPPGTQYRSTQYGGYHSMVRSSGPGRRGPPGPGGAGPRGRDRRDRTVRCDSPGAGGPRLRLGQRGQPGAAGAAAGRYGTAPGGERDSVSDLKGLGFNSGLLRLPHQLRGSSSGRLLRVQAVSTL